MDKTEFLILIPGVLYGIGLADLIKLTFRKHYFETYLWGLILLMILVLQWFDLYDNIGSVTTHRGKFLLSLIVPFIYTTACYNLTPDGDSKAYFMNNRKTLFLLIALLSMSNTLIHLLYDTPDLRLIPKLITIPLLLLAAFWDNMYYRVVLGASIGIFWSQYFIFG